MDKSLKKIHHDLYKVSDIKYSKYLYKDCTAKKKEFVQDKSKEDAINIKNIGKPSIREIKDFDLLNDAIIEIIK